MPAAPNPRQRKNCPRWGWTLSLLAFLVTQIHAQQLPLRAYTSADGLAQDRVKRIVRDSRGFLWFCTADGLSRFDGSRFTNYDASRGLSYPSINDVLETRAGTYWIATNGGGVFRFNPNPTRESPTNERDGQIASRDRSQSTLFINYTVGSNAPSNRVNRLFEDAQRRIWAGTDNGLFVLDESADPQRFDQVDWATPELAGQHVYVWAFNEDSNGDLWLGTTHGLVRRKRNGHMRSYPVRSDAPGNILGLLRDQNGLLWVAHTTGLLIVKPDLDVGVEEQAAPWRVLRRTAADTRTGRILLPLRPGEAYSYSHTDGLPNGFLGVVFQAADGRVWLGGHGGVAVFENSRFRHYSPAQGLGDFILNTLAEDRDGNLWLGTNTIGAIKLAHNGLLTYRKEDGLDDPQIARIFEDTDCQICVLDRGSSIDCLIDTRFQAFRPNIPLETERIEDVLHDHLGEWWLAASTVLYRFPPGGATQLARVRPIAYTAADGLTGQTLRRLFEDSRGDIWISSPGKNPLARWERATGEFHRYGVGEGLPQEGSILSFAEDKEGNVWLGFRDHGLWRHRAGEFRLLTDDRLPSLETAAVHVDRAGSLWTNPVARGLVRIENPATAHSDIRTYSMTEGLTSNIIPTITEDHAGRIYVGTTRSVDRLNPVTGRVRQYTVADGLAANESISAYCDRCGRLWFGTTNGLSLLVPEKDPEQTDAPPILIGGLSVSGVAEQLSELGETRISDLLFDHTRNQVQVDFFGLGFATGEVLRYQFMLEGADRDWGPPLDQRSVNYANLKPGSYRFLVRAVNADGVVSAEPAFVAFTITPPMWQRWWFITIVAVALAAAIHLIYRYHTRRLIELERVRTRIATDLHDDIGASLSKIAILSEVASQELAPQQRHVAESLAQVAGTSRETVDAMSDIVWAVNPQRDHLSDLLHRMRRFAEDLLDAREIEFTFHANDHGRDARLSADLRREVYLIFKECVNNLVKHSGCTKADLEFRVDGHWLVVKVNDNGRGFDTTQVHADGRSAGLGGHGLGSMHRRARALRGSFVIDSERGRGTSVTLRIPTNHRQRWLQRSPRYPNGR